MHPARYLLLLNIKSPSWHHQGGSHNSLGWEDVAQALGMGNLSPLAHTLGRAKYCEDPDCCQQLLAQVQTLVTGLALKQRWRCRSDVPARLARLATHEAMADTRCSACDGRGVNRRQQSCRYCEGSGREPMKSAERYHYAGIDKRNWERRWQRRYEAIFSLLCDAENQLLGHLAWQLHG